MAVGTLDIRQAQFSPSKRDVDDLTTEYYIVEKEDRRPPHNEPAIVRHRHGMTLRYYCERDQDCDHIKAVKRTYKF